MYLKSLELVGFKSFAKKTQLDFNVPITGIVGPNGSGKSNVAEAFRFVLGEQSIKSLRGKRGEDLIFNGSKTIGRQNRASVKITLDNSKRLLDIDFDEVTIERVVHRDNNNEYIINGSQVRLKDVIELLAQAHMGSTGHHIISQGEADRILNANIKERRMMIEDALGLKIYQYKRQESERKLEKTRENISQVESLRKEISPHLKFLRKQVEKIEKSKELRAELVGLYRIYFKRESLYLQNEREKINEERKAPKEESTVLERELAKAKEILSKAKESDRKSLRVMELEERISSLRVKKDERTREAGRLEGEISSEQRRLKKLIDVASVAENRTIPFRDVRVWSEELSSNIKSIEAESDISKFRMLLGKLKDSIVSFVKQYEAKEDRSAVAEAEEEIRKLVKEKTGIEKDIEAVLKEENEVQTEYRRFKDEIEKEKDSSRDAEKEMFRIMAKQSELHSRLDILKNQEDKIRIEEDEFNRELTEAGVLAGREATDFLNEAILDENAKNVDMSAVLSEPRSGQAERRRYIEKLKVRLEELGGATGEEVMKEYNDVSERDRFLERETEDLEKSALSLESLVRELSDRLDIEFREGVKKINAQFEEFFKIMFGGGSAALVVVKEEKRKKNEDDVEGILMEDGADRMAEDEDEPKEGIEVSVSLPHKRIKGLEMLSGGERALTSIALLFAVSQVNPPPFIILDETDAALDEANSKKYGDMISNLSKYSQLILITHNRETMSHAGVIYGVTMTQDAVSKLLSIQFEEAVRVAK